uniref:NAC domain-containing protein n=1 Tax=Leersia perrieri TaxID=77586 RepID=A0A0D9VUD4_9ORYZ
MEGSSSFKPTVKKKFVLNLPAGFHFKPTDDELVVHFLRRKIAGQQMLLPIFIDLFEDRLSNVVDAKQLCPDPAPLVEKYEEYGEVRWFFFNKREKKYNIGTQPIRTTPNGTWKATGSFRSIRTGAGDDGEGEVVGRVRTLVYYANGDDQPTEWTKYEYENVASLEEAQAKTTNKLDEWVLWTIQKKQNCGKNGVRKGKKGMKRKEPSPDSGNNGGNSSADEEQDDRSATTGDKEGRKQRKGRKKGKKANVVEETPNAKQINADIFLVKRSPAPLPPPLPEPSQSLPQVNNSINIFQDLQPLAEHVPHLHSEMMGMNNFSLDPNQSIQQHQQAIVSTMPMDPTASNSTAFSQSQLIVTSQPQGVLELTRTMPFLSPTLSPSAMTMAWAQTLSVSHESSSSHYGANMMMSQNSIVNRTFPNFFRYDYTYEAADPIGHSYHHAAVAMQNNPMGRNSYANFGHGNGFFGDVQFNVAAPSPRRMF